MTDQSRGGAGNCSICSHPAVVIINDFLKAGKVVLDGMEFAKAVQLTEYLNKKYPNAYPIKNYNITRHKPHVQGFEQGTAMILQGNKLFRPNAEGELQEVRQFEPEVALRIIISIGLDDLVNKRIRMGSKVLVDAIKIYSDITAGKSDNDEYDKLVADAHKGRVVDVTPTTVDDEGYLDIPVSQIPDGVVPPNLEEPDEADA